MSLVERTRTKDGEPASAAGSPSKTPLFETLDELHRRHVPDSRWHAEPIIILLVIATSLAVLNYITTAPVLGWLLGRSEASLPAEWTSAFWVGCRFVCYVIVPAGTLWVLRLNPLDFGLRLRGVRQHTPLYIALALIMFPIVVAVSFTDAFQRYYPFYGYAGESLGGLLLWEALYAVQFVALEFFFRGFMLFSLERYLGVYAVFVMVIPYCMIHFGKPLAETLAAIPAGVVLGALALRTRSIWPGALLHIAVGWTMDALSLWQQGRLLWS
jgi:membrane protease YdiL (CAAX protease family)